MKKALEDTNQLGAVRLRRPKSAGDLYVIGTINESNGENIAINNRVIGIDAEAGSIKTTNIK